MIDIAADNFDFCTQMYCKYVNLSEVTQFRSHTLRSNTRSHIAAQNSNLEHYSRRPIFKVSMQCRYTLVMRYKLLVFYMQIW